MTAALSLPLACSACGDLAGEREARADAQPEAERIVFTATHERDGRRLGTFEAVCVSTDLNGVPGWFVVENWPLAGAHIRAAYSLDANLRLVKGWFFEEGPSGSRLTAFERRAGGYSISAGGADPGTLVPSAESCLLRAAGAHLLLGRLAPLGRSGPWSSAIPTIDPLPEPELADRPIRSMTVAGDGAGIAATWGGRQTRIRAAGSSAVSAVELSSGSVLVAREPTTSSEVEFLSARLRPLKSDGKPWDASFKDFGHPGWGVVARMAGYPELAWLAKIPHENRPDLALSISAPGGASSSTRPVQGSFLATWQNVILPLDAASRSRIGVAIYDMDLSEHDFAGGWDLDPLRLARTRGLSRLENGGQVHELRLVVRGPSDSQAQPIVIEGVRATVRPCNPQGRVWDGLYPLPASVTDNRAVPEQLRGVVSMMLPDPRVTIVAPGQRLDLGGADDTCVCDFELGAWLIVARPGSGEGLRLILTDKDEAIDDPIGDVFIPVEEFLRNRSGRKVEVQGRPEEGIERVEIRFWAP